MATPSQQISDKLSIKKIKSLSMVSIIAYIVKFLIDLVMYIFLIYDKGSIYADDYLLFIPHLSSSVAICVFYIIFFSKAFYGWLYKVSALVLMLSNLAFAVLLCFDRQVGYLFYYTLVATINFLNSLFIKVNITPDKKQGGAEYVPLLFEAFAFFSMAISLYAMVCSFPLPRTHATIEYWKIYDVFTGMKLNLVAELILVILYIIIYRNDCEYIRDNMYYSKEIDE